MRLYTPHIIQTMPQQHYDYTRGDAMATPVVPIAPERFDIARYEAYAAECDQQFAEFLQQDEGVAVVHRTRAAQVFRDGCRDMSLSLRLQLGALEKSMEYATDAPNYLEPWYGVGTFAAAFGAEYDWPEEQAPAVKHPYNAFEEFPGDVAAQFEDIPIMQQILTMIEYFLEETQGRLPMSWSDLQAPINVAGGGILDTSRFLMGLHEEPENVRDMLNAAADVAIRFTQRQSDVIGKALVKPGHGFASSFCGKGIGLSEDNLIMISPRMYKQFCVQYNTKIGEHFDGTVIHSCGNWGKWIEAVKTIPNLERVDGAFSPQTDPAYNTCEVFRDALLNTGITLQVRIIGDVEEIIRRVKRLWRPGIKLIVITALQNPRAQQKLYNDIHQLCS